MALETPFEVYYPDERRWQPVMPGYVNAFLRTGPGETVELLGRLAAGETLHFNGWRLRQRTRTAAAKTPGNKSKSVRHKTRTAATKTSAKEAS